jgi:hypothetical protein
MMGEAEKSKKELLEEAQALHTSLDRRLQMLLKKPYLSDEEDLEAKTLKKKKLYYKDIMERLRGELEKEKP